MSLSSVSLFLACVGAVLSLGNQIQRWLDKRAEGTVDEHRLDVEGLRTLATELRTELTGERDLRRKAEEDLSEERSRSRARIADLEAQLHKMDEAHQAELAELRRELRSAHDAIDKIQVEREMRRR